MFKTSCPARYAFPLTPPGRLRAMTARLQATLEAVQTVRPPLEAFYNSLSDEQKERFNELGPSKLRSSVEVTAALPSDSKACAEAKPGLTNLPIEQIDEVVKPTDDSGESARRAGGRHAESGVDPASGLSGGHAADAAGPVGGDGDSGCKP